jgi:hypothetical protein
MISKYYGFSNKNVSPVAVSPGYLVRFVKTLIQIGNNMIQIDETIKESLVNFWRV